MQRVFDVENEKDMQDLFNILPDEISYGKKVDEGGTTFFNFDGVSLYHIRRMIAINWQDKTEIERPMWEATEADIGKLCVFWNFEQGTFGKGTLCCTVLEKIDEDAKDYRYIGRAFDTGFLHCRRLTRKEIGELC